MGLGFSLNIHGFNYQQFLLPGIIAQTLLFTSMFLGISVIWDRQLGFMKEVLVAPVSRLSVFVGKMLGVGTNAMLQGFIVLIIGIALGMPLRLCSICLTIPIMILITTGLVCLGLIIASIITSLESFGTIANFVNLPMFFLSGALFPVTDLPSWLKWAFYVNPFTYCVDALRSVMLSGWQPLLPLQYDILIICIFNAVVIIIGTHLFSKMK